MKKKRERERDEKRREKRDKKERGERLLRNRRKGEDAHERIGTQEGRRAHRMLTAPSTAARVASVCGSHKGISIAWYICKAVVKAAQDCACMAKT